MWYFENSPRLSQDADRAFDQIDRGLGIVAVPTIVLAEIVHISEKGSATMSFAEIVSRIHESENFGIVSLDLGILMRMRDLTALELHDRIIVATALSFDARLVTRDEAIRGSGLVECTW